MGITTEFSTDLALRAHNTPGRQEEECLPEKLEAGNIYYFLKKGPRAYYMEGAFPLYRTEGNGPCSRPLAAISILYVTQIPTLNEETGKLEVWTEGAYGVHEVFDEKDPTVHFEGMWWVK